MALYARDLFKRSPIPLAAPPQLKTVRILTSHYILYPGRYQCHTRSGDRKELPADVADDLIAKGLAVALNDSQPVMSEATHPLPGAGE